jgi:nitrite reductase/ring-hydroxylating ferredoxin subunit
MTESATTQAGSDEQAVGRIEDFPPGSHRVVDVGARQIGVFNIDGTLHALPNICPHQAGPLCTASRLTGALRADASDDWRPAWRHEGEIITCPWHGLQYHVPTGQSLHYKQVRIRRYEVSVRDGQVFIRVGRPRARS